MAETYTKQISHEKKQNQHQYYWLRTMKSYLFFLKIDYNPIITYLLAKNGRSFDYSE